MICWMGRRRRCQPEARVKGWHDEHVQRRRRDQAEQDQQRHRCLNLATGLAQAHGQGDKGEAGGQRGHEDGRETFFRTAYDGRAQVAFRAAGQQPLDVVDHDHAVARGDAKQGDEADDRRDRSAAAGRVSPGHPSAQPHPPGQHPHRLHP